MPALTCQQGGAAEASTVQAPPISPALFAFQMPGTEEAQDPCGPEGSKSNSESPKQGGGKTKPKSRLSGEWEPLPGATLLQTTS